jgi:hypothetical protein
MSYGVSEFYFLFVCGMIRKAVFIGGAKGGSSTWSWRKRVDGGRGATARLRGMEDIALYEYVLLWERSLK